MTVGQQDEADAFAAMYAAYVARTLEAARRPGGVGAWRRPDEDAMREAFRAGIERGLSLRGCCEDD